MEVVPSVTLRFQQFVQIINRQTSPLCAPCMRTYFCDCMGRTWSHSSTTKACYIYSQLMYIHTYICMYEYEAYVQLLNSCESHTQLSLKIVASVTNAIHSTYIGNSKT